MLVISKASVAIPLSALALAIALGAFGRPDAKMAPPPVFEASPSPMPASGVLAPSEPAYEAAVVYRAPL